nr:MAG TPA: hypothetical protein [Caudoviricetes sp.]
MSDTSNQIIQTLEALHEDIKSAKEALKENNVVLESNTTSTLTAEINKIPTAIKESSVLEGFNNGKNTLHGGFIYNTDTYELNNANAVLLKADEYIFPDNKNITIDFPSVDVARDAHNAGNSTFNIKTTGRVNNLYDHILKPIYKTYADNHLNSTKIEYPYKINIHLDKENLDSDGILSTNEFVFPNVNTNFYYKDNEQDVLVTKFKANRFHFSLNYKGRNADITCNELVIDLDTVFPICEAVGHNGYEVIDDTEYNGFKDDNDAHIIKLPVFNVSYSGITTPFNGLAEHAYVDSTSYNPQYTNIQIRTEDSAENIARIHQDKHLGTILRIFEIYNIDGTKKYDPNTKTFVNKDEYIFTTDFFNLMKDKNNYTSNRYLIAFRYPGFVPINAKEFMDNEKKERKAALAGLTIKPGYAYFASNTPIPGDLFKFDDYNQPPVYDNFPLLAIDENVINFNRNSSPNGSNMIIGNNEVKFTVSDLLDISLKDVLPFINLCAVDPYVSGATYNGITIQNTSSKTTKERNGITYDVLGAIPRLLFAPYTTKLKDSNDGDITNIECNFMPLVYNSTIQRVNIVSYPDRKGELQVMIGHGLIYQVNDPTYDKAPIPSTPMKYIIDKDTSIVRSKSKRYNVLSNQYTYHLGPASTDELAKYYDKYVHVLCPEDHPQLGTYDFCKFRLPLYNLDETKKYNYSKKVWEPVGSTTDDSLALDAIYPTEYAEESSRRPITVFANPGFELNPI